MSTIGRNISRLRRNLGMTQEDLAKKMGYKSKSTINKIELGINDIPQSKIIQFAEVLGITPAYLMGWDEEEKDSPCFPQLAEEKKPVENSELVSETMIIYHRDGKTVKREFTKEQMDLLVKMIEAIPEKPKDI